LERAPRCARRPAVIPAPFDHRFGSNREFKLMHKCYATSKEFADATLGFLREKVPKNWPDFCHSIIANFRVI
jgi:hypothetical protein